MKRALILVDIQNDFVPGGNLAVPEGDEIVPIVNSMLASYDLVVATQDWHPTNHQSFASQHNDKNVGDLIELDGLEQMVWPDHCVQHTRGAQFVPGLKTERIHKVFYKGTNARIDSYSGFFDNAHRQATGLGDFLKEKEVGQVAIVGLATDYCVKFTALDAVTLGFDTSVIKAGVRGVDLSPGDCDQALDEMKRAGVTIA